MSEQVDIPQDAYDELKELQQIGTHNLFTEVVEACQVHGKLALLEFIQTNKEDYVDGFLGNKEFNPV